MHDKTELTLRQTLHSAGLSMTATRRIVYEALRNQEPLTMQQLVLRCPGVDRASVYRTVQIFERLHIVQRLQTGWKYKLELSDQFHDHHHHATCLGCQATIVMPEDLAIERQLQAWSQQVRFEIIGHQLELTGYCVDCRQAA